MTPSASLKEQVDFISNLLKDEYIVPDIDVEASLELLKARGVVVGTGNMLELKKGDSATKYGIFLASFVWPFVECYWTAMLYLRALLSGGEIKFGALCHKVLISVQG